MRHKADNIRRRRAYRAGHRAERVALVWLALKGYRPLARRYTIRGGELDLVMRRGDVVAFVEVKLRPTLDQAASSVTAGKTTRMKRAAAAWLAQHPTAAACTLRGDIVALAPWSWPRHLAGAIALGTGE